MIDMLVVAEPTDLFLGMPLPALLATISLISVVSGALVTGLVKKLRSPADDTKDRVVVLDASDRLIQRFETLLKESDAKHNKEIRELSQKVDGLEAEVEKLRDERLTMLGALRAVIQIAKRFGGHDAVEEMRSIDMPDSVRV